MFHVRLSSYSTDLRLYSVHLGIYVLLRKKTPFLTQSHPEQLISVRPRSLDPFYTVTYNIKLAIQLLGHSVAQSQKILLHAICRVFLRQQL